MMPERGRTKQSNNFINLHLCVHAFPSSPARVTGMHNNHLLPSTNYFAKDKGGGGSVSLCARVFVCGCECVWLWRCGVVMVCCGCWVVGVCLSLNVCVCV